MECSKKNVTTGDKFVEELISGEFKKIIDLIRD